MATASLQAHDTWFFHVDPNAVNVSYNLKTKVTNTYGGKIVQILANNWDNLSVDFDSGSGGDDFVSGREYQRAFGDFFKDAMIWQRDTRQPCIFSYPNRNMVLQVFLDTITIKDELTNVRFPFVLKAKVQEDLLGTLKKEAMTATLSKLTDGIGWSKTEYTYNENKSAGSPAAQVAATYQENIDGGTLGGL